MWKQIESMCSNKGKLNKNVDLTHTNIASKADVLTTCHPIYPAAAWGRSTWSAALRWRLVQIAITNLKSLSSRTLIQNYQEKTKMVDESFDCFDTDPKGESRIRKRTEKAQEEKIGL